ncbi:MAG: rRNA pseudouridine synthase [Akkermansiaceae bacterium]|nr:rRNA pseudouridine synthase [Akkermansiaceae bacterium]
MRIDAILSRFGYCSRREAALWVKRGRVTVPGRTLKSASDKAEPAEVLIDGEPVEFVNGLYVALHKPLGCTCSHKEAGELVYDLLPPQWLNRSNGVSTVGRLDKETSGLLLLTDDGAFVHALTSPKKHVPKVYEFETAAPIPEPAVALFASGELLLDGETTPCLPAELQITAPCHGLLTLHEGRYHQVRRMLAAVGAPVISLTRTAIGPLKLADLHLTPGEWAEIDPTIFS